MFLTPEARLGFKIGFPDELPSSILAEASRALSASADGCFHFKNSRSACEILGPLGPEL
jgi:hypothetical protein